MTIRSLILAFILMTVFAGTASAHPGHPEHEVPPLLRNVDVDQRLNRSVPTNLTFKDETGRPAKLSQFIHDKPVILTLNYFQCPQLCPLMLKGVGDTLQTVKYNIGEDFDVITVSIDPRETPKQAAEAKSTYLQAYNRPNAGKGWHFLTGDPATIKQLAQAVGITYNYDAKLKQFAHPSVITFLTPQAKIARYLFGFSYDPNDVQLALSEASRNKIGSLADKVKFSCYQFDPQTGKYSAYALGLARVAGILTVGLMGFFILGALYRERRSSGGMPTGGVG